MDGKCATQSGVVSVLVSQDGKYASQSGMVSVLLSHGWQVC